MMNISKTAVLDSAHVGDIKGALGSISVNDVAPRKSLFSKLKTLAAILGPGLIVMVADNDAGAFGTYTQAGQNFGTMLLWTLLLLIPVLFVNQEMVLRLGAVTGVGHARLIFERFGKFWGAFSIIDLFILNSMTIVTEFIGISLAFDYFGLPKILGVAGAAILTMATAMTGSFRVFERVSMFLCIGSLLLIPIMFFVHPPLGVLMHGLFIPQFPGGNLSDVLLLIIAIVGTTVAPWQLFLQQSYVVDKRITPRFIPYEKLDLWIGIAFAVVGGIVMMAFSAALFTGHPEFGNFTDAGGIAKGLSTYVGQLPGILFALALIDASIIGAMAVSLSTAYALGDVFSMKHSLHRKVSDAKGFYITYGGLIAGAAALVLMPNAPLGLITEVVQALAGILLPAATVFLLLLCNDKEILGPWVNSKWTNILTGSIIIVLVMLSLILTASVAFPAISSTAILWILGAGGAVALSYVGVSVFKKHQSIPKMDVDWRMPQLSELGLKTISIGTRFWMLILRAYLVGAIGLIILKAIQMIN